MKKRTLLTFDILSVMAILLSALLNLSARVFRNKTGNVKNVIHNNKDTYNRIIEAINNTFSIEGYNEILSERKQILVLPLEVEETDLINHEKSFVYKNEQKNVFIILSISFINNNSSHNKGSSDLYNKPINVNETDDFYTDFYNLGYPEDQVARYSLNYKGSHFSLIAFTKDDVIMIAAMELSRFTNLFIEFLKKF